MVDQERDTERQATMPIEAFNDGAIDLTGAGQKRRIKSSKRANDLDGATWTRYSVSVWSDIRKTPEELALGHPALFPISLVTRLIRCFTRADDQVILDPFAGVGSVPIAAEALGKTGIGIEISPEFVVKAKARPAVPTMLDQEFVLQPQQGVRIIHCDDARNLRKYARRESVDLVITSPPYWDVPLQERTADYKAIRHYGESPADLGKIKEYQRFLNELEEIFRLVFDALKPRKYCCVIVMDLRKGDRFYPYHMDITSRLRDVEFILDDMIIWDRRLDYSNFRPLGYPYRFRVNKAHEFILIFQKPAL